MRKLIKILLLLLFVVFVSVSCDFSTLFGKGKDSPDYLTIESFVLDVSQNTILNKSVTGVVYGDTVNLVLPYDVLNQNMPLVSTVKISSGASISPDPTIPVSYKTPVKYTLTKGADYKVFTVYASIDPDTISFLKVSNPFYVDANGVEQPLPNATIEYNGTDILLNLPTTYFPSIESKRIGFNTVYFPYNGTIDPAIHYGSVMPYTVEVSSKDGNSRHNYSFLLQRNDSPDNGVAWCTANARKVYRYTAVQKYDKDALDTLLLNSNGNCLDVTNGYCPGGPASQFCCPSVCPIPIYYLVYGKISTFTNQYEIHSTSSAGSVTLFLANISDSNNLYPSIVNSPVPIPGIFYSFSDPFDINFGSTTVNNNFSYSSIPDADFNHVGKSTVFNFTISIFNSTCGNIARSFYYNSNPINITFYETRSFTPLDYYKFDSFSLGCSIYSHFENVSFFSIVQSYSINGNELVFTMKDFGAKKVIGAIGFFDIVSETGVRKTFFLVMEE